MTEKQQIIKPDMAIHSGETILDLMHEGGISQKEFALRSGESESRLKDNRWQSMLTSLNLFTEDFLAEEIESLPIEDNSAR